MNFAPIQAWNRFWFAPVSAKPLGVFRIAFGCLAVFNLLLMTVDFDYWLTDRGMIQGNESSAIAGLLRPSILHWMRDPISVRVFLGFTVAAAVGLTVGWHTRIMSVLYYFGILMIHHRNIVTASGADSLMVAIAFCMMLSPSGAAYSLDALREAKKRGGLRADPLIIPWAQRLIQIQIALLYLTTALLKTHGSAWLGGTALHYVVCNREIGRWDFSALAGYPVLVNLMTYGGLAIEFSLGLLIWFKVARPWVILGGMSLHFGILFLVNIPIFGELCQASYLLFLTSGEWESLASRVDLSGRVSRVWASLRRKTELLPAPKPFAAAKESIARSSGSV